MTFTPIAAEHFSTSHDLWRAFLAHRSDLPEGKSGDWSVTKFSVTKEDVMISNMRLVMSGAGYRAIQPGDYTRLCHGSAVVMSDTQAEKYEHQAALKAQGRVLVTGMGMGMVMPFLLCNPRVTAVTVVERSQDVINLSAAHFQHPKLRVIHADAMTWKPEKGETFDFCWHDIWTDLCGDNLPQMATLTRRFARFGKPVQDCWGRDYLRRERARERRRGYRW